MLTETEIKGLINKVCGKELPAWKKNYYARICEKLQVHTKGLLFSKVDTLFPHEHPDSKAHCVNTYEPITKGSIWKSINNVNRIFCNSGFSVFAADSTINYVNESRFDSKNLFSFFVEKWIEQTIATDPNSLIAVYPERYLEDYPGNPVKFIFSEHIIHTGNDFVAFVSEDESNKTYEVQDSIVSREVFYDDNIKDLNSKSVIQKTYNQKLVVKITGKVYHIFTKKELIRLYQNESGAYEYEVYDFKKELNNIPAKHVTAQRLLQGINESFVEPFIPFGNLAILQHRNHRAVDLMFSYPRMSEIQTPCDNLACRDGHVSDPSDPEKQVNCSRCKGSGFVTVQSPYKVYQKQIDTGLSDPDTVRTLLAASPVDFHTPEVSILNYSKDSWRDYLAMAEEAVFIQQKQKTGNTESAKAKEIDKEGEYSWIQNISKALNTDLLFTIQAIEDYNNARNTIVSVEQPIAFALVTETDAFLALETIISSDAPVFVKAQQVENYITRYVSKSNPVVRALRILKLIDPLLFYNSKDIQTFKSNNAVSVDAYTTHIYAYMELMRLYESDKILFEKEDSDIIKLVQEGIAKLKQSGSGSLKQNLLEVA